MMMRLEVEFCDFFTGCDDSGSFWMGGNSDVMKANGEGKWERYLLKVGNYL